MVNKKKFDIITLRETHGTVSDIKWGGGTIWVEYLVYGTTGERTSRGVATLFQYPPRGSDKRGYKVDNDGWVLSCEVKLETHAYN